jgi:hypothetical protein
MYKLFSTRENFYDVDEVVGNLDKQKYLVGYLYDESDYRYLKYKTLNKRKATVVALGSSRVLPFRREMFEADFYNAGFIIDNIQDFETFLRCIPEENLPDYLILGLDQWMFNDAWNNLIPKPKFHWTMNNSFATARAIKTTIDLYPDWVTGRLDLQNQARGHSNDVELIGLNAHVHSTGFRNDGSIYYGELIQKLNRGDTSISDFRYKNTFRRIRNGNERFQYADEVSSNALVILDRLLLYCKSNGIEVIGFVPPFADAVYAHMRGSGNYKYLEKLQPALQPVFDKYRFGLHYYNTVSECGSNDRETTDGFHGGERTYLRIVIDMLKNRSPLNNVSNLTNREKDLMRHRDNYLLYPY